MLMNYVQADNGDMVLSIGAPGSLERVRTTYPKLIDKLKSAKPKSMQDAEFIMAAHGVNSQMERANLLTLLTFFPPVVSHREIDPQI